MNSILPAHCKNDAMSPRLIKRKQIKKLKDTLESFLHTKIIPAKNQDHCSVLNHGIARSFASTYRTLTIS
jgi:hypothetical protein